MFLIHKNFKINDSHILFADIADNDSIKKEIVDLLLSTNPNIHALNSSGATLLHYVYNPYLLEKLISRGADVNALDRHGRTPLACTRTHFGLTKKAQLIAAGTIIDTKTYNQMKGAFGDELEILEQFPPFVQNPQATLAIIDQLPPEEKEEQLTQLLTYCVLGRSRPLLRIILQAAETADRTGVLRKRLNNLAMDLTQERDIQSIRTMMRGLRGLAGDAVRAQLEQS